MGREVRRVKADWVHPVNERGGFIPLLDGWTYESALKDWDAAVAEFGIQLAIERHGEPPNGGDYMPRWTDEEADHLMMYEDTTEGAPLSPAFKTPEELAGWLAANGASAFGGLTATYEQWLSTIKRGWAPSAVVRGNAMTSGVAGSHEGEK